MGSASLAAQWPKDPAPGVPRDAEQRIRMDAPTPRTADGKPDLSGNWIRFRGEGAFNPPELAGLTRNPAAAAQTAAPAPHPARRPSDARAAPGSKLAADCRILGDGRERSRRPSDDTVGL